MGWDNNYSWNFKPKDFTSQTKQVFLTSFLFRPHQVEERVYFWKMMFGETIPFSGPGKITVQFEKFHNITYSSCEFSIPYTCRSLTTFDFGIICSALRILGMSWGVKNTFFEVPEMSLGGSGVSIGGADRPLLLKEADRELNGRWHG